MNELQIPVVAALSLFAFATWVVSIHKTMRADQVFSDTPWLFPLGIFVWGDGVLIGVFWMLTFLSTFIHGSMQILWILASLFWVVRSAGEVAYWLLEQFAETKRNKPHTLMGYKLFPGESIWFAYQVSWQIVLIFALFSLLWSVGVIRL